MKYTINILTAFILLIAISQISATEEEERYEELRAMCLERHGITEEELEEDNSNEELQKKFKCFTHCLAKEGEFLDESGKLNLEKLEKDEMDEDELTHLRQCKEEHDAEEDPCEYSYKIMLCAVEKTN